MESRGPREPLRPVPQKPAASIIIRTKNEEALLGETLARVRAQTVLDFEVIVVDSGSTDRTLEIARSFRVEIIEIPAREFTYGRSLNLGSERARGDVLVNLSAHALPLTHEWLAHLLGHFADPQVAGAWGGQTADMRGSPSPRVYSQDLAGYLRDVYLGFSNANGAVRRSLWQTRRWREDLPATEDKEWAHWALTSGHRLVFDGRAEVFHYHQESTIQIWRRAHREHAGYGAFIDLPPISAAEVLRETYWQSLGEVRGQRGWARQAGFMRALPHIVAQQIGRYTGGRAARQLARTTAAG